MQNPDVDLNLILDFVEEHSIEEGACLGAAFDSYLNGNANFRDAGLSDGFEALNRLKSQLETNRDAYQGLYNYDRILDCIENVIRARELASRYDGDNGMVEGGQYRNQMMAKKVIEISEALLEQSGNIKNIVGYVDAMKVRSSMTLFMAADPEIEVFGKVLDKFYDGKQDDVTLRIIGKNA